MIVLNWNDEDKQYSKEESIYLYVIAEIYKTYSSKDSLLKDTDVVKIMNDKYGLPNIDEHIIKRYRTLLEGFGYVFDISEEVKEKKIINRRGYYLSFIDGGFDDEILLNMCLLAKCNKSFFKGDANTLIEDLSNLASKRKTKELMNEIINIELIDDSDSEQSLNLSENIKRVLFAIKQKSQISFNYHNSLDFEGKPIILYPQCVFVKNDEFFLMGVDYFKKNDTFISHAHFYKFSHIDDIRRLKYRWKDRYQNESGSITDYYIYNGKERINKIKIKDLLNGISEIKEGHIYHQYFEMFETVFETKEMPYKNIAKLLIDLKDKYGTNLKYELKETQSFNDTKNTVHKRYKATITIKAIPEEILGIAFRYYRELKIISPERIKKDFLRRTKFIKEVAYKDN